MSTPTPTPTPVTESDILQRLSALSITPTLNDQIIEHKPVVSVEDWEGALKEVEGLKGVEYVCTKTVSDLCFMLLQRGVELRYGT